MYAELYTLDCLRGGLRGGLSLRSGLGLVGRLRLIGRLRLSCRFRMWLDHISAVTGQDLVDKHIRLLNLLKAASAGNNDRAGVKGGNSNLLTCTNRPTIACTGADRIAARADSLRGG